MDRSLPPTLRLDSKKIKRIREEKGLTQLYVATVIGVTIDTISRWENKRYPSVKRENALKLADTLEVPVEDILEDIGDDTARTQGEQGYTGQEGPSTAPSCHNTCVENGLRNAILIGTLALLFGVGGLVLGYFFFRPSNLSIDISAVRFLPSRCAPGSLFPVLVRVDINPATKRTILVKEDIPQILKVTKAVPRYTSVKKGILKWIYQGDTTDLKFVYIARMPPSAQEGKRLRFKGTVTVKTSQTVNVTVGGNNCVVSSPFYWADKNGDNRIDDEEILDAYELLAGVNGMKGILKEVENLWAAGQYKWDRATKRFVPIKESQ